MISSQYVAGFLDADGTLNLGRIKSYKPYQCHLSIELYNADIGILKAIQQQWGGKIRGGLPPKNPNHNRGWKLIFYAKEGFKLLEDIYPFMLHKKKRKRADLILTYYKEYTPRNGKYSDDLIEKKIWLINEVRSVVMRGKGAYE